MALKIYLIRHGETDFNKLNKEWGQDGEISLNDWGNLQAEKLSEVLNEISFDKLFSSDLKRALQTSEKISESGNIEIITDKRLREYDPGEVDPSSEKWIEKYKEILKSGMSKYDIRPYGGENIWDLIKRIKSFIEEIEKEEGTIVIVAHSGVNMAFMNLSQQRKKNDFLKIKQDNTGINILEFDKNKWEIVKVNDSQHITGIKSNKTKYDNQEKIKEDAKKYILDKLIDVSKEIYFIGDIINAEFGLYDRPYKRYNGSNVEVYTVLKKDFEIPQKWKVSEITNDLEKYEIGKIKINGIKHKVNVTIISNIMEIKEEHKEKIK